MSIDLSVKRAGRPGFKRHQWPLTLAVTEPPGEVGVAQDREDWPAVAAAITGRLEQLRATQMDIAARARVSLTTLRELQHNIRPRRRRPQTLTALSEALGWPPDYLARVLHGENARPHPDEEHDPVLKSLNSVEQELVQPRD